MQDRPNPKDSEETLNNTPSEHFAMSDSEKILKIKDIVDRHGEDLTDGECIDEIIEVLNA